MSGPFLLGNLFGSGGITSVIADNLAVVCATNGNDSTGKIGRLDFPFKTPAAAVAAASAGTTIVVCPGAYSVTTPLAKHLVNWLFHPGATVTYQTSTTANLFDDASGAMTFRVMGRGVLIAQTGVIIADGEGVGPCVVRCRHSGSDIRIECERITMTYTAPYAYAVDQDAGLLYVKADVIESLGSSGSPSNGGVYWVNGEMHVSAGLIHANGIVVQAAVTATPTGDCFIEADHILSDTAQSIYNSSTGQTEAKIWCEARLIEGYVDAQGGKTYVTAQKLTESTTSASTAPAYCEGGLLWVSVEKITSNSATPMIEVDSGTALVTAMQLEDAGGAPQAVQMSGGTLELHGAAATMTAGNGVEHDGGTARLMGCRFDTSAVTGGNPANASAAGLILDRCTLKSHSGQSCVAGTATITNYASKANVAKAAGITVNVDTITVDANVV